MNLIKNKPQKKKPAFRNVAEFLHLWLGLISGILVLIVCLTAAIWVFRDEVNYLARPKERIAASDQQFLPPSVLLAKAKQYLVATHTPYPLQWYGIAYRSKKQTAVVNFQHTDSSYRSLHLNPYTGVVSHIEDDRNSKTGKFFTFIRAGHRFLWLPREIGSPIVGAGCILFLITAITGLIWWYPQKWNTATVKKSFTIKWDASWKRVNIDLHNVLGFYSLLFCCILIITGIAFSFKWFDAGLHYMLTGRQKEKPPVIAKSNGGYVFDISKDTIDNIWALASQVSNRHNEAATLSFPSEKRKQYEAVFFKKAGHIHNLQRFEINPATLAVQQKSVTYDSLSVGSKLYHLNFELHVGTIYGLPTKILAFIVSLIGASFPVTGFIIWYNRKRKAARKAQPRRKVLL